MRERFRIRRPGAALIIAVIALVFALAGGAVAAKKLSLGVLSDGAKNKTVGVGKLTYVSTTTNAQTEDQAVTPAQCPAGTNVIGGGIKLNQPNVSGDSSWVEDSYPTTTGWAGHVFFSDESQNAITTAICAKSRAVTGAPPAG
jgi:hypothetical protein